MEKTLSLLVLACGVARLASVAADQLDKPYDLIYESPNLRTIQVIRAGGNIYDPAVYADVPFVLTIYTPLYHYITAVLPQAADNPFLTGRLVSLTFMVLAPLTLLLVGGKDRRFLALLAVGIYWLIWPVTTNAALLKNDSLALLAAAAAVVTAGRTSSRCGLFAAAVLAWLAVASKQSYAAAAAACFLTYWCGNRRAAWWFAGVFGTLCLVSGVAAVLWWGPGVVYSLTAGTRQEQDWPHFAGNWQEMLRQPLFVAVVVLANLALVMLLWRRPRETCRAPFLWYFLFTSGLLLATLGKMGASNNYFLEPSLAGLMLWLFSQNDNRRGWCMIVALLALGGCALGEMSWGESKNYNLVHVYLSPAERLQVYEQRIEEIEKLTSKSPRIFNSYMAYLTAELPGEVSVSDPYLYWLLWEADQLDADQVVRSLDEKHYDLLIMRPRFVPWLEPMQSKAVTAIHEAFARNYRFAQRGVDVDYWLPVDARKPTPPPAGLPGR